MRRRPGDEVFLAGSYAGCFGEHLFRWGIGVTQGFGVTQCVVDDAARVVLPQVHRFPFGASERNTHVCFGGGAGGVDEVAHGADGASELVGVSG